jgi:hypothetical protein
MKRWFSALSIDRKVAIGVAGLLLLVVTTFSGLAFGGVSNQTLRTPLQV